MTRSLPRLAALVAAALVAAACTHRDAAPGPTVAAEPDDDLLPREVIDDLVAETERTRQLQLREPIEATTMTQEEIRALVQREIGESDLARAQAIMRAFGFIPPDLDLGQQLVDLYTQEVLGMYDPRLNSLIVLRSVAAGLDEPSSAALEARMVLAHELTHALQDQNFETLDRSDEEAWSDDAESVLSCLAEGDATLTMFVGAIPEGSPLDPTLSPNFRQFLRAQGDAALPQSDALAGAPPYFGHVLAAIYLEGAAFVADLRRLGGWRAVDAAHRAPPRGTRDVLHTEAYLTGRRIVELAIPAELPGLEAQAWERVADATLGELETSAYLLNLGDANRARAAADGWAGDRFAVFRAREGDRLALVWRLSFEDAAEAAEFVTAAEASELAAGRGPCTALGPSARRCHGDADVIASRGADVVVLRDAPPDAAAALAERLFAIEAVPRAVEPPQPDILEPWLAERAAQTGDAGGFVRE